MLSVVLLLIENSVYCRKKNVQNYTSTQVEISYTRRLTDSITICEKVPNIYQFFHHNIAHFEIKNVHI